MQLRNFFSIILVCFLGACCTKEDCPVESFPAAFEGFSAAELDTIRVITEDLDGVYPPDTLYTRAVFYGGGNRASLEQAHPFNVRNSYTYYLRAVGRSYRIDGYEFTYESCNSCFPAAAESKDHAVVAAFRLNGMRVEGGEIVIRR